jgi:hypothetical protein
VHRRARQATMQLCFPGAVKGFTAAPCSLQRASNMQQFMFNSVAMRLRQEAVPKLQRCHRLR